MSFKILLLTIISINFVLSILLIGILIKKRDWFMRQDVILKEKHPKAARAIKIILWVVILIGLIAIIDDFICRI